MTSVPVLLDLVVVLALAVLLGALLEHFRQSAIVGYLAAGVLLGPGGFHVVRSLETVHILSEIGLALLLFTIGLEFSWRRLQRLGSVAAGGGALQILLTALLFALVGKSLGLGGREAVAMGAVLSLSSTAVVLRALSDRAEIDSVHGRSALGILLLQDIAVVPLGLMMAFLGEKGTIGSASVALTAALAAGAVLFGVMALVSRFVLPRLLVASSGARNREIAIVLAAVVCLGAMWSSQAAGLSLTLGAFIGGMLLAESPFAEQIRADVEPLRAVFVTVFFVSIGMQVDVQWFVGHLAQVAGVVFAVVVGKAVVTTLVVRLFQSSWKEASATGVTLAQIGEFSFVLAVIAVGHGVVGPERFRLFVSAVPVTLLLTPYLVAMAPALAEGVERRLHAWGIAPAQGGGEGETERELEGHVIVVGFGPAGESVAHALKALGTTVLVVDLNPQSIAAARADGFLAKVGDAARGEILQSSRIESAQALVVTAPDPRAARLVIAQGRKMAPEVPIVARGRFHRYADDLRHAGASVVVDEESLVGEHLGHEILKEIRLPADAADAATDALHGEESDSVS
ncbi:MAG: cation:proton antiporter [Acidobacteriota bacterium]|nr:MAG: cation:proton antiporter [Acidobacteriota bacterium]